MRQTIAAAVLAAFVLGAASTLAYPKAPTDATVDTYFGVRVPDPYRPLETLDSPQTQAWLSAEEALTARYFAGIPQRAAIHAHLDRLVSYPKRGLPFHAGNHYFSWRNSGLQNQYVLYTMDGPHGKARVLLDPNGLSTDGTVSVGDTSPTRDGTMIAYATQRSGSDWETWHVRSVITGRDLPDTLGWSKFSGAAWRNDGSGFYYERYATPIAGQALRAALGDERVYFHRLGTPQSADSLVYSDPAHSDYFYGVGVSFDGRYLILTQSSGTSIDNRLYYEDLRAAQPHFVGLFTKNDASYGFVDNVGSRFLVRTDLAAPNGRVIAIDVGAPARVRTIVPESTDALQDVAIAGHRLFLQYLHDVHSVVVECTYDGVVVRTIALPGVGIASGFDGWPDDRTTYYSFTNYTTPAEGFALNIATGHSALVVPSHARFDASAFTTKELFYRSKDGTRIPLFVSYRKGLTLNGNNPTILYAYGGFDIPILPSFSPVNVAWMQMGGIYAVANIRGGSEYGEAWHRAAMLEHKQRVFDDFIAAAEYLIAHKYTSTPKLAIKGESNGGLLIGAVETQRPDLFGAALPGVGVMDMLRFQDFTVGKAWEAEYGCSTCSKAQFETLYAYSPYHNIKPNTVYPATMISTADHDDRVFPAHSLKYAARLQADQAGPAPIILRIDTKSGHGGGKPLAKIIDDYADEYAFLVRNLHMTLPPAYTSASSSSMVAPTRI
jgi:prolyl oligopeptidase